MSRRLITKRIGEILTERGVITKNQLEKALARQHEQGGLLGQVLVDLGFVSEEEVALALTAQYGFPYLPLESYEIDESVTSIVSEELARKHCLIAIDRIGNALTLAMADPSNLQAIEEIETLTKCVVQAFVSTPSDVNKAIGKFYQHNPSHPSSPAAGDNGSTGSSTRSPGTREKPQ